MSNESTKEFRVKDYVRLFEKSLNYIAGAIFSMLAAGIIYISSKPEWDLSLKEIIQIIDNEPKELFCALAAILSTLPYYFYYSLKDNTDWNACNGSKDNWGLLKICILYEIGIFSFFYSILQGDVHFALSKLIISIINIILISIYLILLFIGNKSGDRIGYFVAVIALAILFFVGLSINSFYKFSENFYSQNYCVLLMLLLFSCNAGVNLFFLTRWDSSEEIGIISNRIKIMIPVISVSIYTVSIIYCFLVFENNWWIMLTMALWITLYEIVISCIKVRDNKHKVIRCIVSFVVFVFGIPVILKIIGKNEILPDELSLNWLILIGISIYIAAIKYWGYILKFLFVNNGRMESKSKIMSIMVWFRNSILGSLLFISIILISSERYYLLLMIILMCSLTSEYFIFKNTFSGDVKNTNKVYIRGRIIEFFAIIMPCVFFALGNYFGFELVAHLEFDIDLPKYTELTIVFLCVFAMVGYIEWKWKGNQKEKQTVPLTSSDWDIKQLFKKIPQLVNKIELIIMQVFPDKNRGSFITLFLSWSIYIAITAVVLGFFPPISKYRILGLFITIIIVIADWNFLSKHLLDYYIDKMKEGAHTVKFIKAFQKEWDECLKTLGDFDEIDAKQFKTGDRLRPIMFFLGSSYKRYNTLDDKDYDNIAKAACSLELIHKSSVMFDDFIDKDSMRKGEKTFHEQYSDINTMILLGNAMLAKAQINFVNCREKDIFKCSDSAMIENTKELAQIIVDLCTGCYKELSRADYDKQDEDEIKNIIYLETVSLIKRSIGLGYSCFHDDQGHEDYETIEQLGESFGYVFQYLNDLEPFSQKSLYERHKGKKSHFDYGKKNIALITLYKLASNEERNIFNNPDYDKIIKLYQKYEIEQKILEMVKEEITKIEQLLDELKAGNDEWINAFKRLFNYALEKKEWKEKITPL